MTHANGGSAAPTADPRPFIGSHARVRPARLRGGPSARVQYLLLKALRRVAKRFNKRGFLRGAWTLGRIFDPDNTLVAELGEGVRLEIPLWDGYWMWAGLGEPYEPEIGLALSHVLTPDVTFIDGGANIGFWSAQVAGSSRVTVAVEASPATCLRLKRTAELNGDRFIVRHAALWSSDGGTVPMAVRSRRHAAASVSMGGPGATEPVTVDVPTATLRSLYEDHGGEGPLVVKLDIEGCEGPVIESSHDLFASAPMLCLYEDHGRDRESPLTAELLRAGLRIWLLTPRGTRRIDRASELRRHKIDPRRGYNLAAALPDTPFAAKLEEIART